MVAPGQEGSLWRHRDFLLLAIASIGGVIGGALGTAIGSWAAGFRVYFSPLRRMRDIPSQ